MSQYSKVISFLYRFLAVKIMAKLNLRHDDKFVIKFFKKLAVVVLQTTQNLAISRYFAEHGKEMYQEL